jgi:hypothetical protein
MEDIRRGESINRPSCWNSLHFLESVHGLDLLVYQRSLNLNGVMPYDLVALTNLQMYVAKAVNSAPGHFHWFIGSLHATAEFVRSTYTHDGGIVVPYEIADNPSLCYSTLDSEDRFNVLLGTATTAP